MLTLPPKAFLPWRDLEVQKRRDFIERRDRLFTHCTFAERQCLILFAQWYGLQRHQLLKSPNILSDSYMTAFRYRHLRMPHPKPSAKTLGMASIWRRICDIDRWLQQRLQRKIIARLESMRQRYGDEALMGVANYLRVLPVEICSGALRSLEEQLEQFAQKCARSTDFSPQQRMDSLIRSISATPDSTNSARLRTEVWPTLLAVAEHDIAAGLRLIDAHWRSERTPCILMPLYLNDVPELAHRLAVIFHHRRPAFAIDMLEDSLMSASFQLNKLEGSAFDALEQRMDASCRLLASWLEALPSEAWAASLRSISCLLRYGNPADSYWATLPGAALDIVRRLDHEQQQQYIRLMTEVPFYADRGSPQEAEGMALFETFTRQALAVPEGMIKAPQMAVYDVCKALSILENKTLSFRNRRVDANPDHPLQYIVDASLQQALQRLIVHAPQTALSNIVIIALALSNHALVRKLHHTLRAQFEQRARAFPADGGEALKNLIQYRHYSQVPDEMYHSEICQETFDLLVPILDGISPPDAAVARSGIGWNPRAEYI